MQWQEDNLSTRLLNRHYKAMPEAKKGKLNIKIMNKINKITILSDDFSLKRSEDYPIGQNLAFYQ